MKTGVFLTAASALFLWMGTALADPTCSVTGGTGTGLVTFGSRVTGSFTNHTTTTYTLAVNQGAGGNYTGFNTNWLYAEVPAWTPGFA